MPAGLQVFNTSGLVQIDQDHFNFGLRAKGSATCSTPLGGASNKRYASVVITDAVSPIVATHFSGTLGLLQVSVSGSTWTYFFVGPNGQTFEYFVFDTYTAAMGGDFGLEVYDAASARRFSSASPPAKIAAVGQTFSGLTSGRKYAACMASTGLRQTYEEDLLGGSGDYLYTADLAAILHDGNTGISAFWMNHESYLTPTLGSDIADPLPGAFLLDCTNY